MKINLFKITFDQVIIRFYLMMAIVIASFYLKVEIVGLLALPIFLSALLGMQFKLNKKEKVERTIVQPQLTSRTFDNLAA